MTSQNPKTKQSLSPSTIEKVVMPDGPHNLIDLSQMSKGIDRPTTREMVAQYPERPQGTVASHLVGGRNSKSKAEGLASSLKDPRNQAAYFERLNFLQEEAIGIHQGAKNSSAVQKPEEAIDFLTTRENGTPAIRVLDWAGKWKDLRSLTGLDLMHFMRKDGKVFPSFSVPVERDLNNREHPEERNFKKVAHLGYEISYSLDLYGPAASYFMFGTGKGSAARASASIASMRECKSVKTKQLVHYVNLSKPETVPEGILKNPATFYRPYMLKAIENGLRPVLQADGDIDWVATFEVYRGCSKYQREQLLKSWKDGESSNFEIDGEILCGLGVCRDLGVDPLGGFQFRAVSLWEEKEIEVLEPIQEDWMQNPDLEARTSKTRLAVGEAVKQGKVEWKGYHKGFAVPHPALYENVVLVDVNAFKGANKSILKDKVKLVVEDPSLALTNNTPTEVLAFAAISSLSYDPTDPRSIVPTVFPSWQLLFLMPSINVVEYARRHWDTIISGVENLYASGELTPELRSFLLSGSLKMMIADPEEDRNTPTEVRDFLALMALDWDNVKELKLHTHRSVVTALQNSLIKYLNNGKYCLYPMGQTVEGGFKENRVHASRQYIASAPELPMLGRLKVNNSKGKEVLDAPLTCCYHPDPRWWGKLGLVWRYPIMKETTIMLCLYLQPPEYRKVEVEEERFIEVDGHRVKDAVQVLKYSSLCYMSPEAVKILFFGDTDGDTINFQLFKILGDEDAVIEMNGIRGFTVTINKREGTDDLNLLRSYATIQMNDYWMNQGRELVDIVYLMDELEGHVKQPIDLDWSSPGGADLAASIAKSSMGSVAYMYWAATSLLREVIQLKELQKAGSFVVADEGKSVKFEMDRPARFAGKLAHLNNAQSILSSLITWAPLQGEAAVCGAKYDLTWHAAMALYGTARGMTFDPCITNGKACEHLANKCEDNCKQCPTLGLLSIKERSSMQTEEVKADIEGHTELAPFIQMADAIMETVGKPVVESDLEQLYTLHSTMLQQAAWEIDNFRKVAAGSITRDGKPAFAKKPGDKRWFSLNYSPRFTGKTQITPKMSAEELRGRSGLSLVRKVEEMFSAPNFLCNVFTELMRFNRETLFSSILSVDNAAHSELTSLANLACIKFDTNKKREARIHWTNQLSSRDETTGDIIPLVNQEGFSEDKVVKIRDLLVTNDVLLSGRIPSLREKLDDYKSGTSLMGLNSQGESTIVGYEPISEKDKGVWHSQIMLPLETGVEAYGELRKLYCKLNWLLLSPSEVESILNSGKKVLSYRFASVDPETVQAAGIDASFASTELREVFTRFVGKVSKKEFKGILSKLEDTERRLWKPIYQAFLEKWDSWKAEATKFEVEAMWRLGHGRGLVNGAGNVLQKTSKPILIGLGETIDSPRALYQFGERLGLEAVSSHLNYYCDSKISTRLDSRIRDLAIFVVRDLGREVKEGDVVEITKTCVLGEARFSGMIGDLPVHIFGDQGEGMPRLLTTAKDWNQNSGEGAAWVRRYKLTDVKELSCHNKRDGKPKKHRRFGTTAILVVEDSPKPPTTPPSTPDGSPSNGGSKDNSSLEADGSMPVDMNPDEDMAQENGIPLANGQPPEDYVPEEDPFSSQPPTQVEANNQSSERSQEQLSVFTVAETQPTVMILAGSKDSASQLMLLQALKASKFEMPQTVIIGRNQGFDPIFRAWAKKAKIEVITMPWNLTKKNGLRTRNEEAIALAEAKVGRENIRVLVIDPANDEAGYDLLSLAQANGLKFCVPMI